MRGTRLKILCGFCKEKVDWKNEKVAARQVTVWMIGDKVLTEQATGEWAHTWCVTQSKGQERMFA